MAQLFVLVLVPAVVATATSTLAWANSTVRLQFIDEVVGIWARHEPEHRLLGAIPAVPDCSSAQHAAFMGEFVALSQKLGDAMGQPIECPHVDPTTGDLLQATSSGLAAYRPSTHQVMFTDAYQRWALDGQRLIAWEGDGVEPAQ